MKVIIIGGVAGGASAAARLRRLDEHAEIILLERGAYISYANCGLPYYIGGEIRTRDALTLQTPEGFAQRFCVQVRTEHEALSIDAAAKTVTVRRVQSGEVYEERYDKLILSPGAEPVRPAWVPQNSPRVFTLRTIPDALRIKEQLAALSAKSALIVGGGMIGVELAENLTHAGVAVTLAELADHLIAPLDFDMAAGVQQYVRDKGVRVLLGAGVQQLRVDEAGTEAVLPHETVRADVVLLCVGVRPESALAQSAGLALSPKGAIRVNDHMQTENADIYAVGDAVEVQQLVSGKAAYVPLAGPANKQGRIAADNLCGIPSQYRGTQGSAVVKLFDMTAAATGMNETALQAAGIAYDKVYTFSASHATYYPGAENLTIKLLFAPESGRVLGAQVVGFSGVDKRCDVLATALRAGLTVDALAELELCYAPPFSSAKDPVNMAGFVAQNVRAGKLRQFFWQEIPALQQRTEVTLLDVRTEEEYADGHIEGAVNLPLDDLRARLQELDAGKPLYVNCQSGLRSYLACRILSQRGFDCYNLAGGYRLYRLAAQEGAFDATPRHACGVEITR